MCKGGTLIYKRKQNSRSLKVSPRDKLKLIQTIKKIRQAVRGFFTSKKIQLKTGLQNVNNRTIRRGLYKHKCNYFRSRKNGNTSHYFSLLLTTSHYFPTTEDVKNCLQHHKKLEKKTKTIEIKTSRIQKLTSTLMVLASHTKPTPWMKQWFQLLVNGGYRTNH